jgi:hypothetical protein
MLRHALGVSGVLAAGVLLAVSAAMNWRFGMTLGRTEFDGQIYGAASAAADCLKALVPFFFFAAIKNRMWSQAAASAIVWSVVTVYSLTSALGHAALNRMDMSGQRVHETQTSADMRADLERMKGQLGSLSIARPRLFKLNWMVSRRSANSLGPMVARTLRQSPAAIIASRFMR